MQNSSHLDALRSFLKKLKEEEQTPNTLRLICRVKALIAYYKGNKINTVASYYDISEKR
jgi:hypothetical protein